MGRITIDKDLPPRRQPGPHKFLYDWRPPPRRQAALHELFQHDLSYLRVHQMITLDVFEIPLEIVVRIRLRTIVHSPHAVPLLGFLKYLLLHRPWHGPAEIQLLDYYYQ